jgi:hypothetical protein
MVFEKSLIRRAKKRRVHLQERTTSTHHSIAHVKEHVFLNSHPAITPRDLASLDSCQEWYFRQHKDWTYDVTYQMGWSVV